MRYEKIQYKWPIAEYNFFLLSSIVFSLVKAAMNALCICKLRNGVSKTPSILLFSTAQVRKEYSPQLSKLLYNCKFKNKEAL